MTSANNESEEESSDEEFEYDSEIDDSSESSEESSDDEEEVVRQNLSIEDVFNGRYVLYQWSAKENYIGTVTDITSNDAKYEITVSLMKRYTVRGNRITFNWPTIPHVVVIDDLPTSCCLRSIPVPLTDRRGTTAIYNIKSFNQKIPIDNICWSLMRSDMLFH